MVNIEYCFQLETGEVELVRSNNTRYAFEVVEENLEHGIIRQKAVNIRRLKKSNLNLLNPDWDETQSPDILKHYNKA